MFSTADKFVYSVGYDSQVRTLDYLYVPEEWDTLDLDIADCATSRDNRFYALLNAE